jgi:hypothetical protein
VVKICQDGGVMGQSPPIDEKIIGMDWIDDGILGCSLIPPMNNAVIE